MRNLGKSGGNLNEIWEISRGNHLEILRKSWGNLDEIWGKSWGNHEKVLGKSWGNIWGFFGKSLANRCKSWDIGGVSGGCLKAISGISWEYLGAIWRMSQVCMEDSEYHQRYILHTDGLSAEGAKADVKKKQKLDHPPYFNSSILYLCSFLFSFFKSCLFARWTDCSKWITVLYLHLRWSCFF